jgi:phosphoribosylformylglycinamidine synthase
MREALVRAIVLHASGTNRDQEAAQALRVAGADAEIVHINRLRLGEYSLDDYGLIVVPGGFSYGDAIGAGRLLALDLQTYLADSLRRFVESGRPVIGICNGFQALVKAGILPANGGLAPASLTDNAEGKFECRWVTLMPGGKSLWTDGIEPIDCPIAHGEGRFVLSRPEDLALLERCGQIALRYAGESYPENPNGSIGAIAGICNPAGNVLGLMPHPEDHIFAWQHPQFRRGMQGRLGLQLFERGVRYASS